MQSIIKKGLLCFIPALFILSLNANEIDKETGLIIAPGFEEVKVNCTVCHSAKFITTQRGDRQTWLDMIRWMQETQGLWKFDNQTEDRILTYLEKNYAPETKSRRANLPKSLLPTK